MGKIKEALIVYCLIILNCKLISVCYQTFLVSLIKSIEETFSQIITSSETVVLVKITPGAKIDNFAF